MMQPLFLMQPEMCSRGAKGKFPIEIEKNISTFTFYLKNKVKNRD